MCQSHRVTNQLPTAVGCSKAWGRGGACSGSLPDGRASPGAESRQRPGGAAGTLRGSGWRGGMRQKDVGRAEGMFSAPAAKVEVTHCYCGYQRG